MVVLCIGQTSGLTWFIVIVPKCMQTIKHGEGRVYVSALLINLGVTSIDLNVCCGLNPIQ